MADMLVKLYALPELAPSLGRLATQGVDIRQAHPSEKKIIAGWARQRFSETIAAECEAAIEQRPITCHIAVEKQPAKTASPNPYDMPPDKLLGFACYDVTSKGMFGPECVCEKHRCKGIGAGLLLSALHAMRAERYAYAVIGCAGPIEFYEKTVGATLIEGSEPGIYRGPLIADSRFHFSLPIK
jgi:hypothetical protein